MIAYINTSMVQGSGFGLSSLDIVASDLHPLHASNSIVKYADDTYLIIPASARSTVTSELEHISSWARKNNLRLNADKSKELIVHKRTRRFDPPQSITGVERITNMKILGVTVSDNLSAESHITDVLSRALALYMRSDRAGCQQLRYTK